MWRILFLYVHFCSAMVTRVVGIFPNEASYMRLVCSYILEYAEEWAYERVYLSPESIRKMMDEQIADTKGNAAWLLSPAGRLGGQRWFLGSGTNRLGAWLPASMTYFMPLEPYRILFCEQLLTQAHSLPEMGGFFMRGKLWESYSTSGIFWRAYENQSFQAL